MDVMIDGFKYNLNVATEPKPQPKLNCTVTLAPI